MNSKIYRYAVKKLPKKQCCEIKICSTGFRIFMQ